MIAPVFVVTEKRACLSQTPGAIICRRFAAGVIAILTLKASKQHSPGSAKSPSRRSATLGSEFQTHHNPERQRCEAFFPREYVGINGSRIRKNSDVRPSMPEFLRIRLQKCFTTLPERVAHSCRTLSGFMCLLSFQPRVRFATLGYDVLTPSASR